MLQHVEGNTSLAEVVQAGAWAGVDGSDKLVQRGVHVDALRRVEVCTKGDGPTRGLGERKQRDSVVTHPQSAPYRLW